MVKKQAAETSSKVTGDVQIVFTSDELSAAIKSDLTLNVEVKKVLPAIERALMFLHEQHVIELQGGLAVLRQASHHVVRLTFRIEALTKTILPI